MPSIWKEEVDTGLINEIFNTVRVPNAKGVLIPLASKEKQVLIRKPEEDFKPEKYPCVSIYNTGDNFSSERYNPNKIKKRMSSGIITLEDSAVPFDLTYNIDFWARYQTDMNAMTKEWLKRHFRQFNLLVIDDGGNEVYVNCLKVSNPRKSDLMSGGERLFHTIISYRIWVEIKDETQYNTNVATKVNIDVSQTK